MKTLIIGVGNPILSDDGVGIHTVRKIQRVLDESNNIVFEEASTGGLILTEMMLGYEKVILIDAIKTKKGKIGDIYSLSSQDFTTTIHTSSPHDMGFIEALNFWKKSIPDKVPTEIKIYAIEIDDNFTYSEDMTKHIKKSISKVVEMILHEVK